ncbi:MAG: ribulose-phosphate 3-epimerase, partial [Pseudomonadota bacterium]
DPLIDAFADAGVQGITFHPEVGNHPHRTLQRIAARGLKAGLSLNPGSSLSRVQPMIGDIDLLLIMTVNPGFGGQRLIASQLEKIAEARSMIDAQRNAGGRPITLQVDGGVAAGTARSVIEAGATCLVAGTAVFSGGADHYADNIATLRNAGGDTETGC